MTDPTTLFRSPPCHCPQYLSLAPLPAEQVTHEVHETERQMKEWLENYRPVRQRTVRSETTKDKADALPPAVYQMAPHAIIPGQSLDFDGKADDASDDRYPNERDTGDEAQGHNDANTVTNATAHGVVTLYLSMTQKLEVCIWTNSNQIQMTRKMYTLGLMTSLKFSRGVSSSQPDKIRVACVANNCKHPCTQSAQRLPFACSNFYENKKPFLIDYFGLVWYAPFDWPKIMITLRSKQVQFDFGLWWWGRPIDVMFEYSCWLFLFNSMSDLPFYCNACSVHLEKTTDKNLV